MGIEHLALLLGGGLAVSWALTGVARHLAIHARLLDHPNERSSHTRPTPRGGGVGIVVAFLGVTLALGVSGRIDRALLWALLGAGGSVALLGLLDDRWQLRARWRFLGHMLAAAWVLICLGPLPAVPLLGQSIDLGMVGLVLGGLYIVWMINLFNFMDGIDGIASIEAIAVSLGGAWLWWQAGGTPAWLLPLVFAACVAGFLIWNFPPAKIFMGDAGSGFLGLVVALFSLWCTRDAPQLFWSWLVLVGCFMVDATATLLRRVARGERFYEAHRSHAYQYASRRHGSHRPVSLAYGALTVFWLLPLAALVAARRLDGVLGVFIAYAPLVALAYHYKAGDRAAQDC